jgi:UrcA family protein
MTKTFTKSTILATIALATLTIGTPALAGQSDDGLPRVEVNAKGIDLTSQDGVDRLTKNVRRAARTVCGSDATGDLALIRAQNACFNHAVADASAQISNLVAKQTASRGTGVTTALADPTMAGRPGQ